MSHLGSGEAVGAGDETQPRVKAEQLQGRQQPLPGLRGQVIVLLRASASFSSENLPDPGSRLHSSGVGLTCSITRVCPLAASKPVL